MVKMMKMQLYDIISKGRNLITITVNIVAIGIGVFYDGNLYGYIYEINNYKILVTCSLTFYSTERSIPTHIARPF